ncbi:hypothetical protein DMUE_5402 [Dictyocoela muelleri]|nr:hypothetical protein DMUE_5402 [Dictyocoela muelleri]
MEIESLINNLDTHKMKHIQVDCKIQNSDILIKRDLPLFETLLSDLFQGIQTFRNTVRLTDWSSQTIVDVFKTLCSDEILNIIEFKTCIEEIFVCMFKAKYSKSTIHTLQHYFRNLHLDKFHTTYEYKTAIDETIKRINIHKSYTQKEIKRLTEETFMFGIEDAILTKFISEGITDFDKIYERMVETENFIISKHVNNEKGNPKNKVGNLANNEKKWCRYHKVNTHNNNECLVQNKVKVKEKINKISDYSLPYIFIKSTNQNTLKLLIDSGSTSSFINHNTLEEEKWPISYTEPIEIKTATGETCSLTGKTKCVIKIIGKETPLEVTFKVIKNLNEDIILCFDFLSKYSDSINLKNGNITLLNHKIHFNKKFTVENLLISSYAKHTIKGNNELENLLKNYKNSVNLEKPIIGKTFKIPTTSNKLKASKSYRCPPYQQKLLDDELNNF